MKELYFPVSLDEAIAVLRRKRSLQDVCKTKEGTTLAYTDRAAAVLESRRSSPKTEVCLLVCHLSERTFSELMHGDFTNFGPCARWLNSHLLELEHGSHGRIEHDSRLSLEIVTR